MKKLFYITLTLVAIVSFTGCGAEKTPYPQKVKTMKTYKDLATWMESNWSFSTSRQNEVHRYIKKEIQSGRSGRDLVLKEMALPATKSYNEGSGYCGDSAILITETLNKIDSNYKAKNIFILNGMGRPNHWVTGFFVDGKLYVMDYGAGHGWSAMMGVHGPYNDLSEYKEFLDSLSLKKFSAKRVFWRE
jgi:hypothetical protein